MKPNRFSRAGRPQGVAFTLVELLVVIAIIALLAAIIFPVFSAVRESTRRGNTLSQMQKLYSAIKQYELDNRAYPDYLFGPALKADGNVATTAAEVGLTMEEAASLVKQQITGSTVDPELSKIRRAQAAFKNSLYPTYISDLSAFSCTNNPIDSPRTKDAAVATRYVQDPSDPNTAAKVDQAYYKYDAFDISPVIAGPTKLDTSKYQVRYSRVWTPLLDPTELDNLSADDRALYKNQLLWKNPSADTYLLMTTYHVPNSKILVMWLNGAGKVLDSGKLLNNDKFKGTDGRDWDAFKLTPTNY